MRWPRIQLPGRPLFKVTCWWLGVRMRLGLAPHGYTNIHLKKRTYVKGHLLRPLTWRTQFSNWLHKATHYEKETKVAAKLSIRVFRKDGTVEDYGVVSKRLVTQAFVKRLAAQMAANFAAGDNWKYHDCGTDSTAESNADTALGIPYGGSRAVGTQADISSGTTGNYRTIGTITFSGSFALREHGVFNAAAVGTLLDRSVHTTINVASGDSVEYTYDLQANPE